MSPPNQGPTGTSGNPFHPNFRYRFSSSFFNPSSTTSTSPSALWQHRAHHHFSHHGHMYGPGFGTGYRCGRGGFVRRLMWFGLGAGAYAWYAHCRETKEAYRRHLQQQEMHQASNEGGVVSVVGTGTGAGTWGAMVGPNAQTPNHGEEWKHWSTDRWGWGCKEKRERERARQDQLQQQQFHQQQQQQQQQWGWGPRAPSNAAAQASSTSPVLSNAPAFESTTGLIDAPNGGQAPEARPGPEPQTVQPHSGPKSSSSERQGEWHVDLDAKRLREAGKAAGESVRLLFVSSTIRFQST
jgi:hypothetical protein